MKPENAVHCFDLDRFDEAGMRNGDRMQDAFERFPPELQKALQLREAKVCSNQEWSGRRYRMFAKVLDGPSISSYLGYSNLRK